MSRRSRRKTLSHAEIEDFLSVIGVEESKQLATLSSVEATDSENIEPNKGSSYRREDEKVVPSVSCGNQSSMPSMNATTSVISNLSSTYATDEDPDEQYIRNYCKIVHSSGNANKELSSQSVHLRDAAYEIGRQILKRTNYRMISHRLIHPEAYTHPKNSIESKKAVLLSLSSMLSDAEKERQIDVAACQNFTKCISEKGKGRYSVFEYRHINTYKLVDYGEYEKSYLAYVEANKAKKVNVTKTRVPLQSSSSSSSLSQQQLEPQSSSAVDRACMSTIETVPVSSILSSSYLSAPVSTLDQIPDSFYSDNATTITIDPPIIDAARPPLWSSSTTSRLLPTVPTLSNDDDLLIFSPAKDISKPATTLRASQSRGGRERRHTLSPNSVRALLLDTLESTEDSGRSSRIPSEHQQQKYSPNQVSCDENINAGCGSNSTGAIVATADLETIDLEIEATTTYSSSVFPTPTQIDVNAEEERDDRCEEISVSSEDSSCAMSVVGVEEGKGQNDSERRDEENLVIVTMSQSSIVPVLSSDLDPIHEPPLIFSSGNKREEGGNLAAITTCGMCERNEDHSDAITTTTDADVTATASIDVEEEADEEKQASALRAEMDALLTECYEDEATPRLTALDNSASQLSTADLLCFSPPPPRQPQTQMSVTLVQNTTAIDFLGFTDGHTADLEIVTPGASSLPESWTGNANAISDVPPTSSTSAVSRHDVCERKDNTEDAATLPLCCPASSVIDSLGEADAGTIVLPFAVAATSTAVRQAVKRGIACSEQQEHSAFARLCVRYEMVEWKYRWEIASVEAAAAAKAWAELKAKNE